MPLSSLDKIRQIRKGMGNPTVGEVTDEDIATYLHLAMKQLATIHEFESLSATEDITLDGSTDYTMTATNVLRLLEPPTNVTSQHPMKLMDLRWDRQVGQYVSSGSPYWVVPISIEVGECVLRFRPVASSGTVRIPYIIVPTTPGHTSATENFSDLPESFDMTEISLGTTIGLELTNQRESASDELQLGAMHQAGAARSMPKSYKHHYLVTAAHRLLGGRRRRR